MEGGGYGSTDHRVRADVGGDGCVGPLLLVDAPHLHPVRRVAHRAAGLGANAAGHLARGPPRCRQDESACRRGAGGKNQRDCRAGHAGGESRGFPEDACPDALDEAAAGGLRGHAPPVSLLTQVAPETVAPQDQHMRYRGFPSQRSNQHRSGREPRKSWKKTKGCFFVHTYGGRKLLLLSTCTAVFRPGTGLASPPLRCVSYAPHPRQKRLAKRPVHTNTPKDRCVLCRHSGHPSVHETILDERVPHGTQVGWCSGALSVPPEPPCSHTSLPSFTRCRTSPCLACLAAVCSRFFSCATSTAHGWQNRPRFDGERVGSNRCVA
jgi:hypothetical protein